MFHFLNKLLQPAPPSLVLGTPAKNEDDFNNRKATAATMNPNGFQRFKEPMDGNGNKIKSHDRRDKKRRARAIYLERCSRNPSKARRHSPNRNSRAKASEDNGTTEQKRKAATV